MFSAETVLDGEVLCWAGFCLAQEFDFLFLSHTLFSHALF
jgi:hypothetical protein